MAIMKLIELMKMRKNREKVYRTADYWDWKAAEHEGDAVSMWPNNCLNYYYHREQLSLLQQYLPDVKGAKVLDVGCGTGRISRYLASHGATVLGIDFSSNVIALAQKESSIGNPTYRVQSVFDLEEKGEFDALISWGVLTVAVTNRIELVEIMQRLKRSLKYGGKALFLEPVHSGFLHRVLNMDIQEFSGAMNEAGFTIVAVKEMHFWPARLALCFVTWPKFVTAAGYHLGQFIMHNLGLKNMGDYKAIIAVNSEDTAVEII
jgi:2-polyprenyl-3-methyl-5-hydroxy-6-metoxy-1,4-benzoquinol methylase